MKKFSKLVTKIVTVATAAALVFANSGVKALAKEIKLGYYVVNSNDVVIDTTTGKTSIRSRI